MAKASRATLLEDLLRWNARIGSLLPESEQSWIKFAEGGFRTTFFPDWVPPGIPGKRLDALRMAKFRVAVHWQEVTTTLLSVAKAYRSESEYLKKAVEALDRPELGRVRQMAEKRIEWPDLLEKLADVSIALSALHEQVRLRRGNSLLQRAAKLLGHKTDAQRTEELIGELLAEYERLRLHLATAVDGLSNVEG